MPKPGPGPSPAPKNSAPSIIKKSTSATGAVTERPGLDADAADIHTPSAATLVGGGTIPPPTLFALQAALATTVTQESSKGSTGLITWNFSVQDNRNKSAG